jgi:hypothetical protein
MAKEMTSQKINDEKKCDSNCGIVHIRKAKVEAEVGIPSFALLT